MTSSNTTDSGTRREVTAPGCHLETEMEEGHWPAKWVTLFGFAHWTWHLAAKGWGWTKIISLEIWDVSVCLFVSTDNPSLSYSPSFKDDAKNTGYGCGLSYGGLRQSTESNVGKQEDKERNVQSYITRSVNVVMVARWRSLRLAGYAARMDIT